MKRYSLLIYCILLSASALAQSFEEVAAMHGISESFGDGVYGGGISFVDFNMDGWDDLTFATAQGDSIHFYQNNGGSFVKIPALIPHTAHARQIIWVDYDNDGDRDLYVATGFGANHLYKNDGTMKLTDITAQVGLSVGAADSFGAHFGDINNDGWLDLYVLNRHQQTHYNNLYLFDGVTYTDITHESGLKYGPHMSFVAAFIDYNQDGLQDIYIAEDKYFGNKLFENNGDTTFTEVSASTNCYYEIDAMNVGIGDPNRDGYPDIYITNTPASINPESKLLMNIEGDDFDEMALEMNVNFPARTGWCANWLDFDNDADEDLYVCASAGLPPSGMATNAFYTNNDTAFVENNLPNDHKESYCNAVGDFNQDGKLDIAVSHADSIFSLFENTEVDSLHWLKVQLEGSTANREGIGSQIEVWTDSIKQTRWVLCGEAYLAQNSFTQHFGMDTLTQIDSLKITWLGGQEDIYYDIPTDTIYHFIQKTNVLPIELIDFDAIAHGDKALLNWQIESQNEIGKAELQKSTDGQLFLSIATFDIQNDQLNHFNYSDTDTQSSRDYYYRLKIISADAAIKYSAVETVSFDTDNTVLVYPTILKAGKLTIQSRSQGIQSIQIIDSQGKIVFSENYDSTNQVSLQKLTLAKGTYYVLMKLSSDEIIVREFIQI